MKIQKALEENGKAKIKSNPHLYVKTNDCGALVWVGIISGKMCGSVSLESVLNDNWQPYHEVEEIRPEKGQTWESCGQRKCFIFKVSDKDLWHVFGDGTRSLVHREMIHGKNGWTRLDPPVEESHVKIGIDALMKACCDDEKPFVMDEMSARAAGKWPLKKNYETIEIDRVEWGSDGEVIFPRGGYADWKKLIGRPPMKMILVMAKEEHECQG